MQFPCSYFEEVAVVFCLEKNGSLSKLAPASLNRFFKVIYRKIDLSLDQF